MIETVGAWWMWAGFVAFVIAMIAVDMRFLKTHGAHKVSVREAATWSAVWVLLALAFNAWFWWYLDGSAGREIANEKALEFLTGYLIEKSLAVDNIFVFIMIFGFFAVPAEYQRRVLLYGVLGAIVMRAVMILLGAVLLARFHWVLYVFGAFLVITGIKMLVFAE
jgi:tellurite resistance protein TerC